MRWTGLVTLMTLIVALPGGAQTPTETIASTTAQALPEAAPGWLPFDWIDHPANPVHTFGIDHPSQAGTDRLFPVVIRVDDKLSAPLGGHKWYLWVWRHGLSPRVAGNGGRMQLLTANSLEGPWTDRGFVTPANMSPAGWGPYSWTGGDVVWSDRYQKFFSFPHAYRNGSHPSYPAPGLDSFLMESPDGVNWSHSNVAQPVLPIGPAAYDNFETGYGRLLRLESNDGKERWIWFYRSQERSPAHPDGYYRFAVATAEDVYGPWQKAAYNPVFDPFTGGVLGDRRALIGVNAIVCYGGFYQMIWQTDIGPQAMARSTDLRQWEPFLPYRFGGAHPVGQYNSGWVFWQPRPHAVLVSSGTLVYDPDVGALTFVYLASDAQNVSAIISGGSLPGGTVSLNIARSLAGGNEPYRPTLTANGLAGGCALP